MLYRIDKRECLFLTAFTIYMTLFVLNLTALSMAPAYDNVTRYIYYLSYLLAVIKILIDIFSEKNIWEIVIVAVLVTLMVLQRSGNDYLFFLLMIIAARNVNCRRIVQCFCLIQSIVLIVFVVGAQLGLIENYLFIQEGGRYRYGLGFLYTTYAPTIFCFVMMAYLYLRRERMKIYEFVILEAINFWMYTMTDSRLCFYLSTVMLVYVFFMRYFWQNRKERIRKNRWLILAPAAICVGSILLHVFYNPNNETWAALNRFLNGRLNLGQEALNTYGITWFGQQITWIGNGRSTVAGEYNFVDCSYIKVLLDCGIIFLILIIAAYTYMMYVAVKTNDYYLQTVLLFILILCVTEARLTEWGFNPFLILAATAFRARPLEDLCRKEPILVPGFRIRAAQIRFKDRDWERRGGRAWKKMI